jgi:hypothetical protein
MSDDTETEVPEIEFDLSSESQAETFEWRHPSGNDGGLVIFPSGVEHWADTNGITLVRFSHKTGILEYQRELGTKFVAVDKAEKTDKPAMSLVGS